jgi:hypothetical protein
MPETPATPTCACGHPRHDGGPCPVCLLHICATMKPRPTPPAPGGGEIDGNTTKSTGPGVDFSHPPHPVDTRCGRDIRGFTGPRCQLRRGHDGPCAERATPTPAPASGEDLDRLLAVTKLLVECGESPTEGIAEDQALPEDMPEDMAEHFTDRVRLTSGFWIHKDQPALALIRERDRIVGHLARALAALGKERGNG